MVCRIALIHLVACFLTLFIIDAAEAAVPQLISYQGRLTDNVGNPINGTEALTFTIYGDSLGVSTLWSEAHPSVAVTNGLFQVILGSATTLPQSVFNGNTRWLSVRIGAGASSALMPLVSTAYAYRSNVSDTAAVAKTVSDNAITSAKIQNGTISFADIGQNGATSGQVMKWSGSAWEAQTDATAANTSGWVDNGTVVGLATATDTVSLNSALRLGKLNVGGSMSLTGQSSIYFGTDSTYIKGFTGGDMTLQGEDVFVKTEGSIYTADVSAGNFVEIDNANRLVGIGTTAPDERLQVENSASTGRAFLQIETSHATAFGETGIRFKTPQNTWHLRMDDYTNNNIADGALGLRSGDGAKEVMTWLEGGNVGIGRTNPLRKLHVDGSALIDDSLGIGTTSPSKKLHVYGSAMVKDTLYAGAINPSLMAASRLPDEPGVAGILLGSGTTVSVTADWTTIVSREITVPGPGYILATGTCYVTVNHTYGDGGLMYTGVAESSGGPSLSRWIGWGLGDDVGSGFFGSPMTCQAVYDVSSAGTREYYFMTVKSIANHDVYDIHNAQLSLLYVPTAYGTVSAKDASATTPSRAVGTVLDVAPEKSSPPSATELADRLQKLQGEIDRLKKELESRQ